MAGGTFTISNGGVFGSLFGTPILNLPGSAILGMHAINDKPWVVNGKVEIRPIMVVALTYDHRLLDGESTHSCSLPLLHAPLSACSIEMLTVSLLSCHFQVARPSPSS